jgi:hypothetical protein
MSDSTYDLYSIDRFTAATTLIGSLNGPTSSWLGLTSDNRGELVGLAGKSVFRVDKATGQATVLSTGTLSLYSIAIEGFRDTDQDGLPDYWEKRFGFDENDPFDAALDSDGDGQTNLEEYGSQTDPTDPSSKAASGAATGSGGEISEAVPALSLWGLTIVMALLGASGHRLAGRSGSRSRRLD